MLKTYEFSWKGLEEAKMTKLEIMLSDPKIRTVVIISLAVVMHCQKVLAAGDSADFWQVVHWGQEGLFWLGIFISIFGLYLTLLKKDDTGKKIIWTSFLVYIGSFVIPKAYIMLRAMLQKL